MNKFIFLIFLFVIGCRGKGLLLKKAELPKYYSIDTLEQYPKQGLQVINLINEGAMGHFSVHFAIVKQLSRSSKVIYELQEGNNEWGRLSKDYIAFVKANTILDKGWYSIENGNIKNKLPGIDNIVDSIKNSRPKDISIKEIYGYISVLDNNGKVISEMNYGNLLSPKLKTLNFDSLDYGVYKFSGDSIVTISTETNDIKIQKDGLYFVPPPGSDVIRKYNKEKVLGMVDSATHLSKIPDEIFINPG